LIEQVNVSRTGRWSLGDHDWVLIGIVLPPIGVVEHLETKRPLDLSASAASLATDVLIPYAQLQLRTLTHRVS
jgi:hypothetical protein